MAIPQISIVGAGNLAWHLGPALDNCGYVIDEVYSRNEKSAKQLVNRLYQAEIKKDLDFRDSQSTVFILAVSDEAISEIAQKIHIPNGATLVHTSGSQDMELLQNGYTENLGVFYPLQTFTAGRKVDFNEIPICIEAANKPTWKLLKAISRSLSSKVYHINSATRMFLHLSAVLSCNFTNHLFTISQDILIEQGFDLNILKPLIVETINKSLEIGPDNAQTGPAFRGDLTVLEQHMKELKNNKAISKIYQSITQHILDTYHG